MIVMFGLVSIECFMRKLWGIRRYYVIMICTIVAQWVCECVSVCSLLSYLFYAWHAVVLLFSTRSRYFIFSSANFYCDSKPHQLHSHYTHYLNIFNEIHLARNFFLRSSNDSVSLCVCSWLACIHIHRFWHLNGKSTSQRVDALFHPKHERIFFFVCLVRLMWLRLLCFRNNISRVIHTMNLFTVGMIVFSCMHN